MHTIAAVGLGKHAIAAFKCTHKSNIGRATSKKSTPQCWTWIPVERDMCAPPYLKSACKTESRSCILKKTEMVRIGTGRMIEVRSINIVYIVLHEIQLIMMPRIKIRTPTSWFLLAAYIEWRWSHNTTLSGTHIAVMNDTRPIYKS